MREYTFQCIWSIEANTEEEAWSILFDDLRHNRHSMFDVIQELEVRE